MRPLWPSPQNPRPWRLGRVLGTQAPASLSLFSVLLTLNFPSSFRANDRTDLSKCERKLPWHLLLRGKGSLRPPHFLTHPGSAVPSSRAFPAPAFPAPSAGAFTPPPAGTPLGFLLDTSADSFIFNKLKQGYSFQMFRDKLWARVWPWPGRTAVGARLCALLGAGHRAPQASVSAALVLSGARSTRLISLPICPKLLFFFPSVILWTSLRVLSLLE